jgi:hypothetical protein
MRYQKEITLLLLGGALSTAAFMAKEFLIDRPKERSSFRAVLSRDLYEQGSAAVTKAISAYNALLGGLGEQQGLSRDEFAPIARGFEDAYTQMQRYCEEVRRLGSGGQFRVVDGFRQIMMDEWQYVWIHKKSLDLLKGSALMVREVSNSGDDASSKLMREEWLTRVDRVVKSESYIYYRARDVSLPLFESYRSTFEAVFRSDLGLDLPADFIERQKRTLTWPEKCAPSWPRMSRVRVSWPMKSKRRRNGTSQWLFWRRH